MKGLSSVVAVLGLIAWPSVGEAAFATCQDAWNYGSNTGNVYAGSFYNTLACDGAEREEAEASLASVMSKYVASGVDTDAHLLCMYSGLYNGLLQRASAEYEKCQNYGFCCVRQGTVGQYAAAVLAALFDAVAEPDLLTPQDVKENLALADVTLPGDPACPMCDDIRRNICETAIWEFLRENEREVDPDLVVELVASNCVCLEPI